VAAAHWGIAASQFEQPLLDLSLELDLTRARRLPAAQQGELHPLGDQLPANTGHRSQAGAQGGDDLVVGVSLSAGIVG
jgi:hypothetical protein